ncbi:MAG: hypothetical protein AAGH79_15715 [Bacteroidota bacterium]
MLNDNYTSQSIYLDQAGRVIFSCDQLFSATTLSPEQLMDQFPLVMSIFPSLLTTPLSRDTITIPGVQINEPPIIGIFDFHFSVFGKTNTIVHWQIQDLTRRYQNAQREQQRLHNRLLDSHVQ